MNESAAEGRGGDHDDTMIGTDLRQHASEWRTEQGSDEYVAALRADAFEETLRPPGWVPCTTWWWIDGDVWMGRIALRHRLTRHLLEAGGHVGYDARPSARRRGHASAMLRAVLPHARALGIEQALLTCDVDNLASRLVIETNGGQLEDRRGGKLRFWLPTEPRADDESCLAAKSLNDRRLRRQSRRARRLNVLIRFSDTDPL